MNPSPYPIPSITIPPNFVPKTPADFQMLQLIHQIQSGHASLFDLYLLQQLLNFPFLPIQAKLNLYYFFSSLPFVQSIHLSPLWLSLLVLLIPSLTILVPLLFIFLLIILVKKGPGFLPHILGRFNFNKVTEEKAFLELTFPSNITKSAYATEQLYKLLNTRAKKQGWFRSLIKHKKVYSLEIVSSRDSGIQFVLVVPKKEAELLHHTLISFLPGLKVKEVEDYLTGLDGQIEDSAWGVVELKLGADFVLPLQDQKVLEEHDPISFLIGAMTKLDLGELIAFQIVTTPIIHSVQSKIESHLRKIRLAISRGEPLTPLLQPSALDRLTSSFWPLKIPIILLKVIFGVLKFAGLFVWSMILAFLDSNRKDIPFLMTPKIEVHATSDPFEKELAEIVREKASQHLFETSIRILIASENELEFESRADSITASLGQFTTSYQSLISVSSMLPSSFVQNRRFANFKSRSLPGGFGGGTNPILSASELADLYHFPNTDLNKVEGLVKHKSKDLPAPLSIKRSDSHLDVVIGLNTYGNEITPIGLSGDQRKGHTYMIGKTGSGKTTIIKGMVLQDIANGKGVCFVDPHGDAAEEIIEMVPENRAKDVIYVNPADGQWPVGLNILAPGTTFEDLDEAHEKITNCLMSVFQKITPPDKWGQRMEHILRNATLTALQIKPGIAQTPFLSLIAIHKLLTSQDYRKEVIPHIKDPILKQFWQEEFASYGKHQIADIVSPLTNKLGEFVTSVRSRYILLQKESSINISEIMDSGKILIVNLSKGKLGEERSAFFGTLFTSLIQLAAYAREKIPEKNRHDYFVYIDEFQNFATEHFVDIFSEARKYHVYFILSHQNIAQIIDQGLLEGIATNTDTLIVLKTGPADERFILPYMEPEVEKGAIINLDPHHFYMKTTSSKSEDAFSGETAPFEGEVNKKMAEKIIQNTRKNYARPKEEVEKEIAALFGIKTKRQTSKGKQKQTKNFSKNGHKRSKIHKV